MYLLHTQLMVNLEISIDVQVKVWNHSTLSRAITSMQILHSLMTYTWLK